MTPKMDVREGIHVECGEVLWHDKSYDDIKVVSPVSGIVKAVVRGERRKVLAVEITTDNNVSTTSTASSVPEGADAIKSALMAQGVWAQMRQLPFDIVPMPTSVPRDIFVTLWDAAPTRS